MPDDECIWLCLGISCKCLLKIGREVSITVSIDTRVVVKSRYTLARAAYPIAPSTRLGREHGKHGRIACTERTPLPWHLYIYSSRRSSGNSASSDPVNYCTWLLCTVLIISSSDGDGIPDSGWGIERRNQQFEM